jgi:hypothetical protein
MKWNGVRTGCAIVLFFVFAAVTGAEEKWSNWMFTNNGYIEWRWIAHTYGPDIPPNCNYEFRNKLNGTAQFKYVAGYSWLERGIADQKKGVAYEITATNHGGDSIDKCTRVGSMTVSDLKITN